MCMWGEMAFLTACQAVDIFFGKSASEATAQFLTFSVTAATDANRRGGSGKSRFDDIDTQKFKSPQSLFVDVHAAAGSLFAVLQRRVENLTWSFMFFLLLAELYCTRLIGRCPV